MSGTDAERHVVAHDVLLELCRALDVDPFAVSRIVVTPTLVEIIDERHVIGGGS